MGLAKTLRQAIDDTGCSLNSLAIEAGIQQSSLHRFYHGERDLRLKTAEKLAKVLGLKLDCTCEPRPSL